MSLQPPSRALQRLLGGEPLRAPAQPSQAYHKALTRLDDELGHPGWLNNFSVREHEQAQQRAAIQQSGFEQAECDRLTKELEKSLTEERQKIINLVASLRMQVVASAEEIEEPDDGYESGSESEARTQRKRRAKQKDTPFVKRRAIGGPPPSHADFEVHWAEAWHLFKDGLNKARIDKLRYSKFAWLELIPEMEDGPVFRLRDHQREALGWWIQVIGEYGCFLFADDMGLGKSAVAVARVKLAILAALERGERVRFLFIVPSVLVQNWMREFSRCRSIKVLPYHDGPERDLSEAQMEEYDVIITTYDIVKNHYIEGRKTQRDFTDIQAGYRNIIEREQYAQWQAKEGRKTEDEWKLRRTRPFAPLMTIKFTEMVLDEAHAIRGLDTLKGYAVSHVKADRRVCITGTPVQNSYWDLFALFRFMKLRPFGQKPFFKMAFVDKNAPTSSHKKRLNEDRELTLAAILHAVQLRRLASDDFNGNAMTGVKHWHEILIPVELCAKARERQHSTRDTWDAAARMKKHQAQINELQSAKTAEKKKEVTEKHEKEEKAIFAKMYDAKVNANHLRLLEAKYSETGDMFLEGRSELQHHAQDDIGLRTVQSQTDLNAKARNEAAEYSISDSYAKRRGWASQKRAQLERNEAEYVRKISQGNEWESDKLIAIVSVVDAILTQVEKECARMSKESDRKEYRARNKIIIFFEWLAFGAHLRIGLMRRLGVKTRKFDGTMSQEEREKVRALFEEEGKDFNDPDTQPDDCPVLLATIKAAGEGLTLVHARHVMITSPQWNPYVVLQAIGRAARIGQVGQVWVYRFYSEDSIELRMCDVGNVKRNRVGGLQDLVRFLSNAMRLDKWSAKYFGKMLESGQTTEARGMTIIGPPLSEVA